MKQKILILVVVIVILVALGGLYLFTKPDSQAPNISAETEEKKEALPSETFIEYTDPAGFSFSYPDNLSIEKNEVMDANTYADLQLFSKDVSGSLALRITDTKFKTLNDWVKEVSVSATPIEKQLGNLKGIEVRTGDRILLGAIDQGVLFNIEVPLLEEDFWIKVYDKILADFSFVIPERSATAATTGSSEEVIFESEEVVE